MIQNKEALDQVREEAIKVLDSYDCRILVCSGTGCVATGSQKIYEKFLEIAKDAPGVSIEFGPHDKDAHVGVKKTGCQGVCELGPLVRIQKGDDVIQILRRLSLLSPALCSGARQPVHLRLSVVCRNPYHRIFQILISQRRLTVWK